MKRLVIPVFLCATVLLAGAVGDTAAGKTRKAKILHGRIQTDGILTVGQPETIFTSKLFRKFKVLVSIAPPDGAPGCSGRYFCFSDGVGPAPGAAAFRTDGKGRASLTFTVPSTYGVFDIKHIFGGPTTTSFTNGQTVVLGAGQVRTRHRQFQIASATVPAVIEVPPPPPTP